jgi:thiamine-monophosphate kinase
MGKADPQKTDSSRTSGELGERRIIEILKKSFDTMPDSPVPFGDDVSAVTLNDEQVAIIKTDMLVNKTDIPRGMSLWQAARKAVVMNISDLAAKGVQPQAALAALGLPRNLLLNDIEEIARGLNTGARQYGAYVIGGDTSEASDLTITVAFFGTAEKKTLMLRNGAKAGDTVAVTGFFGKSAAGLRILLNDVAVSKDLREVLVNAVFMPQARLKEGLALSGSRTVTASIDSSDGLAWSLHELARMSDVGFAVNSVPVADEVKRFAEFNRLDALELALYGGEEYELVVTVKPKMWIDAEAAVESVGGRLLPIGRVTRDKEVVLEVDGKKRRIEARGWEHFKSKI